MLMIHTTNPRGRPFLNDHFPSCSEWKWFFGTIRTPHIVEIAWYYTSCVISLSPQMPFSKVGTRDRDDHLKLERRHWWKDQFWTKSYYVISVANNSANPLIFYIWMLHDMSPCYSHEIMPWYYAMILWVFYSFYFGQYGVLSKDHVI